eukprot:gene29162-38225_t
MPTIDDESAQLMIPQHTHENGSRAVSYGLSPHQQPGGMRSINFQADELGLLSHEASERSRMEDSKPSCMGDCFKSVVFGGIDGIVSSLVIISGAAGGRMTWRIALVVGTANLVANSVYTGISEFLSSKAHREFLAAERRREMWEFKHYKDEEMNEMIRRFQSRGMSPRDAESVVQKIAQYENIFVGLMLSEELGLQLSYEDDAMLLTDAFVMFLAYVCMGVIPLLAFAAGPLNILSEENQYFVSAAGSIVILFVLGSLKSRFGSGSWICCGVESAVLGAICAIIAYLLGDAIFRAIAYT